MTDKPKLPEKIQMDYFEDMLMFRVYDPDVKNALSFLAEHYNELIIYLESKEDGK